MLNVSFLTAVIFLVTAVPLLYVIARAPRMNQSFLALQIAGLAGLGTVLFLTFNLRQSSLIDLLVSSAVVSSMVGYILVNFLRRWFL
jgi:multisubunit Na+/H+ antiporter MnhF subunit